MDLPIRPRTAEGFRARQGCPQLELPLPMLIPWIPPQSPKVLILPHRSVRLPLPVSILFPMEPILPRMRQEEFLRLLLLVLVLMLMLP